jgi:hypothetical protein
VSLEEAIDRQRAADDLWSAAIDRHRRAEPNAMFAQRLTTFSNAARRQAESMRYAHTEGLRFQAWEHTARPRQPPAELQRGSGRVGPPELWEDFDRLFAEWAKAVEQTDLSVIAAAYDGLSETTAALADAVDEERGITRSQAEQSG